MTISARSRRAIRPRTLLLLAILLTAVLLRRRPRMEDFRVPEEKLNRRDSILRRLRFLRRTNTMPLDRSQT